MPEISIAAYARLQACRRALTEIVAMVDDGTMPLPNGGNNSRFAKWCLDATEALRRSVVEPATTEPDAQEAETA